MMKKSYMVIDRIEVNNGQSIAVCEIEDALMIDSKRKTEPSSVRCFMADVSTDKFEINGIQPVEQEVYGVFHDGKYVYEVCSLTKEEEKNW